MQISVDPKKRIIRINEVEIYIPRNTSSIDEWVMDFEKRKISEKSARNLLTVVQKEIESKPDYYVDSELIELGIIKKALKKYIDN